MISKKNFFTISVMMITVFFLFMVTGGAKIVLSNYGTNEYYPSGLTVKDTSLTSDVSAQNGMLYLGDSKEVYDRLEEWCVYNKRSLFEIPHGFTYGESGVDLSMLVIDGATLLEEDIPYILSCEKEGITILFATVPSCDFLKAHTEIAELMGIRTIQNEATTLVGMRLYEGFLLGGEAVYEAGEDTPSYYEDLNLRVPWFILESASKVYMSGYLNKAYKDADASYTPPIIWRYNTKNTYVYVVNNDFMEELSALGIYTAVESSRDEISVYPIINSQNMVLYNFPTITNENSTEMMELYSRDTINFIETLVWPSMTAASSANKLIPSFMISSKLDYSNNLSPSEEVLSYLMELVRENHGEAGLSLKGYSDVDGSKKLETDLDAFRSELSEYNFYSCYIGDLSVEDALEDLAENKEEDVNLLISDYSAKENLIRAKDDVIAISPTTDSQYYSYKKDFTLKSVETALGYSLFGQEMDNLIYPKTEENHLQNFAEDYSGTLHTLYEDYEAFDATSVTEAGNRIRTYLNLQYESELSVEKDKLTIKTNIIGEEQYFIVKTAGKQIQSMSEGQFYELEDGVYLITTTAAETVIDIGEKTNSWWSYFR